MQHLAQWTYLSAPEIGRRKSWQSMAKGVMSAEYSQEIDRYMSYRPFVEVPGKRRPSPFFRQQVQALHKLSQLLGIQPSAQHLNIQKSMVNDPPEASSFRHTFQASPSFLATSHNAKFQTGTKDSLFTFRLGFGRVPGSQGASPSSHHQRPEIALHNQWRE